MKSQSAMEYLMTYGWAILIIAVVLGALYSLGLFNGAALAPRAQPGSCQVYRPNGPGTVQYIGLTGSCTNELPEYVPHFNGASSQVSVPDSPTLDITNSITLSVWLKLDPSSAAFKSIVAKTTDWGGLTNGYGIRTYFPAGVIEPWVGNGASTSGVEITVPSSTTWVNVAMTYASGSGGVVYVNGAVVTTLGNVGNINPEVGQPMGFGSSPGGYYLNFSLANVQIYNTSLDANSIKAIYRQGIGGAPINLQNLAGWWPLNGNTNDYSGNLNNGAPTGLTYGNQWISGYTMP